ncbi:polyphosphate kinase [Leptospira ognonensis]|uniref:Polyphosphate kinase n=1 Tax=Leptospira ognonensis TaxID=2484945 RepID=A0A4R9K9M3_9LEPT|nr:polyphosphate kinase [Leptospira ognonensis]
MIRLKDIQPLPKRESSEDEIATLQEQIFILQKESYDKQIGHIFLLEGWSSSGRGELLKALTVRLDPRKFKVYSPFVHKSEDRGYPFLWNFWQYLPRFGESLFYLNTYYGRLIYLLAFEGLDPKEYSHRMLSILNTERILTRDKIRFHKFFLHISEKELSKRIEKSRKEKRDWELSDIDKDQSKHYHKYRKRFEVVLNESNTASSSWEIIPCDDVASAKIYLLKCIIERMEAELKIDSAKELSLLAKGGELLP